MIFTREVVQYEVNARLSIVQFHPDDGSPYSVPIVVHSVDTIRFIPAVRAVVQRGDGERRQACASLSRNARVDPMTALIESIYVAVGGMILAQEPSVPVFNTPVPTIAIIDVRDAISSIISKQAGSTKEAKVSVAASVMEGAKRRAVMETLTPLLTMLTNAEDAWNTARSQASAVSSAALPVSVGFLKAIDDMAAPAKDPLLEDYDIALRYNMLVALKWRTPDWLVKRHEEMVKRLGEGVALSLAPTFDEVEALKG